MKPPTELNNQIEKFLEFTIIVEGKKDASSLKSLGFRKIFQIHKNSCSIKESIDSIALQLKKDDKVCILTDFDKRGKQLHAITKQILQQHKIKVDSTLRKLLAKEGISHIEGLGKFIENNKI